MSFDFGSMGPQRMQDGPEFWNWRQGWDRGRRPSDWGAYISAGGNVADQDAYNNWKNKQSALAWQGDYANSATGLTPEKINSFLTGPNQFEGQMTGSRNRLANLLDNPDSVQNSAAYQFRLKQGLEGVNRGLAAKGLLGSGNRLAALNDYAQGEASQEYGNQFSRLLDLYGRDSNNYFGQQAADTDKFNAGNAARLGWANNFNRTTPSTAGLSGSWLSTGYGTPLQGDFF